jgi:hypothetical protein
MPKVILLCAILVATGLTGYFLGKKAPDVATPAEVTEVQKTPAVITALRDVARLEGAVFHVERVVDLQERQSKLAGLIQAKDAILLVAAGDVTAGVDLAGLVETDVQTEGPVGKVTITLPRAQIFSQRLDSERTYVHSRTTDVLATRRENLETRARQEAERTLAAAAVEGGILVRAEKNVRLSVSALVRSLGFSQVEVRFRGETPSPPAIEPAH